MRTVYLDVYFLLNLWMNLVLLIVTMVVCSEKSSVLRVLAGAVTGAALASFLPFMPVIIRLSAMFFIPVLMVRILWPQLCVRRMAVRTGIMLVLSMLVNGLVNWWYFDVCFSQLTACSLSLVTLAAGGILTCIAMAGKIMGRENKTMFQVLLYVGGKTIVTKGFLDSGNLLKDTSGRAVNIVEKEVVFGGNGKGSDSKSKGEVCGSWKDEVMRTSFRLPYKSLGGDGYITVINADRMVVPGLGEDMSNVPIGLYEGRLFSDGRCHMLLSSSLKRWR